MSSYLIRETGGARRVHAFNCPIVSRYNDEGIEEIPRIKYGKYNTCKMCEKMMYIAGAAEDYAENFQKYKKWFDKVSTKDVIKLTIDKKIKFKIVGDRLFIKMGSERFYLDMSLFDIEEVKLWHNNYHIKKKAEDGASFKDWDKGGYHEHALDNKYNVYFFTNALRYVIYYDPEEAKEVHVKERRHRVKERISEDDPAYWGFTD